MDEKISPKVEAIMEQMEQERVTFGVYCIALASNEHNLFDIINAKELLFSHYKRNEINIIGLGSSKARAIQMVAKIIEQIYQETKGFEVRQYFKDFYKYEKSSKESVLNLEKK